jgi:adenosine deaminase
LKKDERMAIITGLPKIELHRHLEGSIRLTTMLDLGRKYGLDFPLESVTALAQVVCYNNGEPRTLTNFLKKFHSNWYRSYADVERIVQETILDAVQEGIVHLELRFSPEHLTRTSGLQMLGVMQAVCETGLATGQDANISIKFLITLTRERYDFALWKKQVDLAANMTELGLAGIDLAGDEHNYPNFKYEKILLRVRDTGVLKSSVHAGEGTSAEQVESAIQILKANRIGHGISAANSDKAMKLLTETGCALEMCPTSNFQTGCIDNLEDHPLPKMDAAKIAVTINSDDPAIQRTTINDDYDIAVSRWGYTIEDLLRLEQNALQAAFITKEERESLDEKINRGYQESQGQGI